MSELETMTSYSFSEFDEVTTFLAEHRWIFDFKLTRFFQDAVWKDIPEEWTDTLMDLSGEELAGLPFGKTQTEWPESLNNFIQNCVKYTLPREQTPSNCKKSTDRVTSPDYLFQKDNVSGSGNSLEQKDESQECDLRLDTLSDQITSPEINCQDLCQGQVTLKECSEEVDEGEITEIKPSINRIAPLDTSEVDPDIRKGMSKKKLHEVCHMTALIDHVTKIAGNNAIVDVGSGLGYLGQVLHYNYGHSVLGLEGKQGHTTGADRRLNKTENCHLLHNVTCELHQESHQEFLFLVQDWFSMHKKDGNICCHQNVSSKAEDHETGTKIFIEGNSCQQTVSRKAETHETGTKIFLEGNSCQQTVSRKAEDHETGTKILLEGNSCQQTVSRKAEDHETGTKIFLEGNSYQQTVSSKAETHETGTKIFLEGNHCQQTVLRKAKIHETDSAEANSHKTGSCTFQTCANKYYHQTGSNKLEDHETGSCKLEDHETGSIMKQMTASTTAQDMDNTDACQQVSPEMKEDIIDSVNDQKAVINDQKAVINDQKAVINDQKAVKNDQKAVINDQKSVKNDQKAVINDQKSVKSDQKSVKSDQKAVKSDQKSVINDQKAVINDQKSVINDQKSVKSDQKSVKSDQKAVINDQKSMSNDQKAINEIVQNEGNDSGEHVPKLCMVGLHCCGDLTPTMLRYFVELDCITSLCCVSCCYHRMQFNDQLDQHENFPMSRRLIGSLGKVQSAYPRFSFSAYCLRLAAQETRARWHRQTQKDHEFHVQNVAYRGILETCLEQDDKNRPDKGSLFTDDRIFQLKKCVRKLAHKTDYDSFTKYIDAVFKHIDIPGMATPEEGRHVFQRKMEQKYAAYQQYFCLIEPITALQFLLQPVIESLIYLDRKCWLEEHGFHAYIVPIFDEFISPRNLVLVANKVIT